MKPSSFTFRVDSEKFFIITFERTCGKNTKHAVGIILNNENGYIGSTTVDSCNSAIVPMLVSIGTKAAHGIYMKGEQVAQISFGPNTLMIGVGKGNAGKEWQLSDEEFDKFISAYVALGGKK